MTEPIVVEIPHKLGREAARARIAGGVGKLAGWFPGGASVESRWEDDTLHFTVAALGQRVACRLEVFDARVRAEVDLPPMLALFAGKIRDKLLRDGPKLLE